MKRKHLSDVEPLQPKRANYTLTWLTREAMRREEELKRRPGESRDAWFARMIVYADSGPWTKFLEKRMDERH